MAGEVHARADGTAPASRAGQGERDPRRFRGWLGVAPSLLIIGVFMLAPIGIIAVYSLLEADPYGGVRPDFSPEAYLQLIFERDLDDRLVFNDAYIDIFLRSVLLAGAATGLCLLIGFPVAWYMATQPPERRTLLVFLITIPFWTNLLIRTYCWILVLRDTGLVNNALLALGIVEAPITLLYTDGRHPARPRLYLRALHGAADLCRGREARPSPGRSRRTTSMPGACSPCGG